MKWLVFDCASGISGDMTLGALVDVGVPLEHIRSSLSTLPLEGYRLEQASVTRHGIAATHVRVELDAQVASPHRHLHHVLEILRNGKLPQKALAWSEEVFTRLAHAEAAVHRTSVEKVHFHEVGALDAIIDIAGACVGLHWLCEEHGVEAFRVSQIRLGRGTTRSEHGVIPVPPPATLQLLQGWPVQFSDSEGERVTPTGAALLTALTQPLDGGALRVAATGYGAGTREFPEAPNVLRVLLCDPAAHDTRVARATRAGATLTSRAGQIGVLNTTIDDMVPEFYGHLQARLFELGARDVYFTPIYMKKARPATQVTVIAEPEDVGRLADVLFNESSTLGVRIAYEERMELPRRLARVSTNFGVIEVKVAVKPDGRVRHFPEYESVRKAAAAAGVPLEDVYRAALGAEVVDDDDTEASL